MHIAASSKFEIDFGCDGTRVVVRAGDSLLLLKNGLLTCEMHAPESTLSTGVDLDDSLFDFDGPISLGRDFQFVYQRSIAERKYFALCVVSAASDRAGLLLADSVQGVLLGASVQVGEIATIFHNPDSAFAYLFEAYSSALDAPATIH